MEDKNQALQRELEQCTKQCNDLEVEYHNAVEKTKAAKLDTKVSPKGWYTYVVYKFPQEGVFSGMEFPENGSEQSHLLG